MADLDATLKNLEREILALKTAQLAPSIMSMDYRRLDITSSFASPARVEITFRQEGSLPLIYFQNMSSGALVQARATLQKPTNTSMVATIRPPREWPSEVTQNWLISTSVKIASIQVTRL